MKRVGTGSLVALVADDDAVTRRVLTAQLASRFGRVLEAVDGEQALKICQTERVDLVISDWLMPKKTGVEFCRALRSQSARQFTFFIMLTSLQDKHRLYEAFEAGADDFLTKPWDPAELQARLSAAERIVRLERDLTRNIRLGNRLNHRLRRSYQRLEVVATTDALTGLLNRREADARLEAALATARESGQPISIAMVDVDNFKQVNDKYGHKAGDLILKAIAQSMGNSLRSTDLCFRVGGDEFLILMPDTSTSEASVVAGRLRHAAATSIAFTDYSGTGVALSIGIATAHGELPNADRFLARADAALYTEKEAHRVLPPESVRALSA
jgi:two-component system, cell cycle response regulator